VAQEEEQEAVELVVAEAVEDNMPTFLILQGFSGAGKSTSSVTIAKKDKFVLLKEDYFYFGMHPYKKKEREDHAAAYHDMLSSLREHIKFRKNIILEGTLVNVSGEHNPFNLKKFIRIAKRHRYKVVWIILTVEERVSRKRNNKRGLDLPRKLFRLLRRQVLHEAGKEVKYIDTTNLSKKEVVKAIENILKELN
jgi:predicted kinase